MNELIQPSSEPGATRLAIAYAIVREAGVIEKGDWTGAARMVGEAVRIMLEAEARTK